MGDVAMPRLSDSMQEGTILRWLKSDGDRVTPGDELVEIETDEANVTYEADAEGVLEIVAGQGTTLAVGETIARIGAGAEQREPRPAAPSDLPTAVVSGEPGRGETEIVEPSRLQRTVARRMAESKATAPDFVLTVEVDMEAAVQLRDELAAAAGDAPAPSVDDFVIKASALALRDVPRANGAYRDGRFELYSRVNVGVTVAAREALVVPTLFDADRKPLGQVADEARALAERARAGAITPPELSGATFTVANLGPHGIRRFTAVINAPQAAILSVGELAPRAVVRDGEIQARHVMELTLACDHRILYGTDAARFLGRIRAYLEEPARLV